MINMKFVIKHYYTIYTWSCGITENHDLSEQFGTCLSKPTWLVSTWNNSCDKQFKYWKLKSTCLSIKLIYIAVVNIHQTQRTTEEEFTQRRWTVSLLIRNLYSSLEREWCSQLSGNEMCFGVHSCTQVSILNLLGEAEFLECVLHSSKHQ